MAKTKTTTANPSLSIFASPVPVVSKSKAKKVHRLVTVKNTEERNADKLLEDFYAESEIFENAEAKLKIIKSDLKNIGNDEFLNQYKLTGRRPENFLIGGENTDKKVMWMVQDKYITVKEENLGQLQEVCPDLVETTVTYSFDAKLFSKVEAEIKAALSKAILGLKGLTAEEQQRILTVSAETKVKKGAIEELAGYNENLDEVFAAIQPVAFPKKYND